MTLHCVACRRSINGALGATTAVVVADVLSRRTPHSIGVLVCLYVCCKGGRGVVPRCTLNMVLCCSAQRILRNSIVITVFRLVGRCLCGIFACVRYRCGEGDACLLSNGRELHSAVHPSVCATSYSMMFRHRYCKTRSTTNYHMSVW